MTKSDGGGHSHGSPSAEVKTLAAPVLKFDAQTGKLTVEGRPGAVVEVKGQNGQPVAMQVIGSDGHAQVQIPATASNQSITATQKLDGVESAPSSAVFLPLSKPNIGSIDLDKGELSVSGKPGSSVQVLDKDGKPIGDAVTLDGNGQGVIKLPQSVGGESVTVVAKADGKESAATTVDIPLLKPGLGTVDAGKGELPVTGKPGATVQLQDKDGKPIGDAVTLDGNGQGVIQLPQGVGGESVGVVAQSGGQQSPAATIAVPPLKPNLGAVDPQTGKVEVSGKPGATVQLKDAAGKPVGEPVTLNGQGKGEIQIPSTASGQSVSAVQTINGAESLPSAAVNVPLLKPLLGAVDVDNNELPVTGKPGATVQLQDKNGKPVGDAVTLDGEGQGVIKLPQGVGGESVGVVVQSAGQESPASVGDVPLLKPSLGVADSQSGELPVSGKPGSTVQLQDSTGKPLGEAVTLDEQGQGVIKLPQEVSGESVGVVAKVGDQQSPVSVIDLPLLAPVFGIVNAKDNFLQILGKPDALVQLKDEQGRAMGAPVLLDDQGESYVDLAPGLSDKNISMTQSAKGLESVATQMTIPLLTPTLGEVDQQTREVVVEGKPAASFQIFNEQTGKPYLSGTFDALGTAKVKLPGNASGQKIVAAQSEPVLVTSRFKRSLSEDEPTARTGKLPEVRVSEFSPAVEVPLLAPDLVVNDSGDTLNVLGMPDALVELRDPAGVVVGRILLDADGVGTLPLSQSMGGETLNGLVKDKGVESPLSYVDVPLLSVGLGPIDPQTGTIVVTGKPGASVQLQGKDGQPVGEAVTLDAKGQGSIQVPSASSGETLQATQSAKGDQSPAYDSVVVPTLKPALGEVDPQTGKIQVSGKPNATVQLQDSTGKPVGEPVTLNAQGKGEVQVPTTVSGQAVSAVQTVNGADSLPSAAVTVPLLKPVLGAVDADKNELPVSGKPGATVQLQDKDGKPVGEAVVLDDKGQGVIKLPQSVGGESVSVVAKSGNEQSPAATATVPPLKPTLGAVDPQTGKVEVTGKPGAIVQLKDAAGKPVGEPVTLNAQGKGEVQVPTTASGQAVSAVQTVNGTESLPSAAVTVPLLKPVLGAVDADKNELPVSGKPGATVQLQDKNGKPVGEAVVLDEKGQGVIKLPQSVGGESVSVVAKAGDQQSPATTVAVPPLKPTLGAVDPQTGKVEVTGKPGAIVQLKDAAGKPVGEPVTLNEQGKGEIQVPSTVSGQAISAVQKVDGVESLPSAAVEVPLLKPSPGVVDAEKGELSVSGKPGSTVQLQDKDGKPVGEAVVLDEKGQGVIKLPQDMGGESVSIVAKDDDKQSPAAEVELPLLKPLPGVVDAEKGELPVTGKPGSTVQLQDKDGKPVGEAVVLDDKGQGVIKLPQDVGGESVSIVAKDDDKQSPAAEVELPLLKPLPGVVDAEKGELPVTGKPGSTVQLQDKDGKPVGEAVVLDEKGQGVIKLPQDMGGESVSIVAKDDDKQSPAAEVELPLLKPLPGVVDAEKGELPVTGKPGSTVQLQDKDGKPVGEAVVLDDKGQGVIKLPQDVGGESVSIVAKDDDKQSPAAEVELPLLKPLPGVVDAEKGELPVTGKPGSTVQLQDKDGKPVGEAVVLDDKGQGVIKLPQDVGGESVSIVAKDDDKQSPAAEVELPLLKPLPGVVDAEKGELPVTGKPGSTVQLQDKDGKPVGEAVVLDEKGQGVIKLPQDMGGESVSIVAKDDDKQSPAAEVELPLLKPLPGVVDAEKGELPVTGKPGSTVQLQDKDGKPVGEAVVLDDKGQGVIKLPQEVGGESVSIVAKDDGQQSPAAEVEVPLLKPLPGVVDAEKGELPVTGKPGSTVQLQDKDGKPVGEAVVLDEKGQGVIKLPQDVGGESVSIVAKDDDKQSPAAEVELPLLKPLPGVVDAEKGELPVTGKPGSTVQLQDKDGKPVGEAVVLDDKGQGVIKLPQDVGGESVSIVAKDDDKQSPAAEVELPLLKPLPGVVDAEKGELPVTGKPGSTVQLQDKDGKPVGEAVVLDDKGQGVIKLPQDVGGESVSIVAKDDDKQSPAAEVELPLLKPLPGVVDAEKGELPVTGKPGSTVQLQDKDGKPVGEAVVLDEKGQGVIKLPQDVGGESVSIVAKDDGQQSPAAKVEVPLLKPLPGVVDAEKGELPVTGKPGSTVQLQDKDGKPVGEAVVLDEKGQGVIKLPQDVGGESVSIVAKDDDKQSPAAEVELPLLKPLPGVVDAEKGELPVTGKPGSTVQLQDKDGKPVGEAVVLDEKGQGVIKLPQDVGGESVSIVAKDDGQQSPAAKVEVPLLKPLPGVVDAEKGELPVTGKPGSTVQLQDKDGKPVGEAVVLDEKGQGVIKLPQEVGGESVSIVAKDDGQQSPAAKVEVPLLKPLPGVVDAEKGELPVTGKPGSTVQLQDKDGKPVGEAVVLDEKGQGVIKLPQDVGGESVSIVAKDDGQQSPAAKVEVPLLKPLPGVVDAEKGELPVTGKPGSTVQLQDKDGKPVGEAVVLDEKGQGVIKLPQEVGGESVSIVAKDDGQQSPAAKVEVPLLKPLPGVVDAEKGELPVTGKPGSTVQLQDKDGKPVGEAVVLDEKGQGVIKLPQGASGESTSVVAKAGDEQSPAATVVVPPLKPTLGAVDPQTGKVEVSGKPGATVQLKDAAGKPVGEPVTLNEQGKGEIQVPTTASGQAVSAAQTVNGADSLPSAAVTVPLLKPVLGAVDADKNELPVSGKPGATVQLQDKDGKPVGEAVVLDDKGQGVIKLPQSVGGESVSVVAKSGNEQSPAATATVPPLKPTLGAVDPQTGKVEVTGKPGAIVQLKDAAGKPVGEPVTLNAQGKGEVQVPTTASGQAVSAVQTVNGTESLPSAAVTVPLLKPVLGAVDADKNELPVSGKPGATVQLQDKNGKPVGEAVVLDEKGQGVIKLPQSVGGESVSVVAKAGDQQSPATTVAVPPLKPTLGAVDPQTGKVEVTGKPGAIVQLKDAAGKPVGEPVTLNEQGKGEIQVPSTVSGQAISAVQKVDGVESLPSAAVEVPLLKPSPGVVDAEKGELSVSGKPGSTVQLQDKDGKPVGEAVVLDEKGQGVIKLPQDVGGESVSIVAKDDGQQSPAAEVEVPLLKPLPGVVDAEKGELPVTGKPGSTVQLQDKDGKPVGEAVVLDEKGQGVIKLPQDVGGESVSIVAKDDGQQSPAAEVELPLLKPLPGVVDAEKGELPVTGKPGSTVQLQDKDGKPVGEAVVLDEKGQGVIKLPQDVGGESVSIVAKDDDKQSPAAEVELPLLKPLPGVVDAEKGELPVTGKPGSTVQLQDKDGKPVGEAVVLDEKGQGVIKLPQGASGESTSVVAKAGDEQSPAATVVVPPLKPTLGAVDPQTGKVEVSGKPGATVQLKDAAGKPVGEPVTLNEQGKGEIQVPTTTSGQAISAVQTVNGADSLPSAAVTVPLLKPVLGAVDADKNELPVSGKPGATVQLQDKDGKPVGEAVVLDEKGQGVIQLPQSVGGESVSVVAKSGNEQSPAATATVPPLKPTLGAVDPQTGKVEVSGKPGATVQLKDSTGKPVGEPVTLDAQGKGEVQIPTIASGQSVSAVQTVNGVESLPSAAAEVPLLKPTLSTVDLQTGKVEVSGKPGASVQLKDATGKPVGEPVTLSAQGKGEIQIPTTASGQAVTAVQKVGDTESLPSVAANVPLLKPTLGAVNEQTGKVEVSGKPGASVQLKDSTGKPVGEPVILNEQGKGQIQVPPTASSQSVSAVQSDNGTESLPSAAVTVPLLKPVLGAVDADKGELPVTGKPGATVQLQDKDGKPVGEAVVLDEKGQGVIKLPQDVGGESIGIVAEADGKESPVATVEVPLLKPVLGTVDADKGELPVTGKPGSTVQLQDKDGKPVGEAVVLDEKGQGVIKLPQGVGGESVGVVAKDDGQQSPAAMVEVPLLKPVLGAVDADKNELPVSGKPGATVQLQDKDGKPVGDAVTLDDKGQGVIQLPQGVGGESVGVVVKDGDKTSPAATIAVPPLKPTLGAVDPQTGKVEVVGKPDATVQLQDSTGKPVGEPVTLNEQGKGEIQVPTTASGQAVSAVQTVNGADSLPSAAVTVPLLKPVLGAVDADKNELPVSGKPGATVQLQDKDGKPVGEAVVLDEKGQGVIQLPQSVGGESVSVVAKSGNEQSPAATATVPPLKPTLGAVDPQTGKVEVSGKPGATVQLKDSTGKPVGEPVTLNAQGKGEVQVPTTASGQAVSAVQTVNGTESLPSAAVTVPLLKPVLGAVDADKNELPVSGKPGATVQLQDKDGKPVGDAVTLDDKGQGVIQLPQGVGGESVGVVVKDGDKTSPAATIAVPPLKPTLGAVDPQTGKVEVSGKPDATVQLQDSTGKPVGEPVTLDAQGKGEVQIPTTVSGQAVSAVQTVNGAESLPSAAVTVPLLKPVLGAVDADKNELPVSGKPGATVQLQDKDGKPVGEAVVLDEKGQGVIQLPQSVGGESVSVVAKSGNEQSPAATATVPPLKPTLGAVDPQTGKVEVSGKPGATVQLKDSTGKPVGEPVTLDAQGKGEVQIPTTVSGQAVSAVQTVNGAESLPSAAVTVPLLKPVLGAVDADKGELPVSGKPGAKVQLQDKDGKPVGDAVTLDDKGQGVIQLPQSVGGESVGVVVKDGDKTSPAATVAVPPLKPTLGAVDPQTGKVEVVGKPDATVQLKDAAGKPVGEPVKLDGEGKAQVQVPPTASGQAVSAVQTVEGVESLPSAAVTVPLLKPVLGVVDADKGELPVSGKPGAKVQLQDKDGKPVGDAVTLDDKGQGVIQLPQGVGGESVGVVVKDGDKTSPAATIAVPPLKPTLGAVDPQTGKVEVVGKPDATVQLQDSTGKPVGEPVTLDAQGKGEVQVPTTASGQAVSAVQTVNGAESLPSAAVTVPLLKPVLGVVDADKGELPVSGKPGAKVQLQDKDGKPVGDAVTLDDNGQGVIQLPQSVGGEPVSLVVQEGDKTSPAATVDVPLLKPLPGVVDSDKEQLPVTGKPGAIVQLQDKDGKPLGAPVTLDEKGQGVIQLPQGVVGQEVGLVAKANGQTSPVSTVEIPLLKPILGAVDADKGELPVTGKPGASVQLQDKDGKPVGDAVVLDEKGQGVLQLPQSVGGEPVGVVVKVGDKQSPVASTDVPLLKPVGTVDKKNNLLEVQGKPGATVQLKDPSGKPMGGAVALDAQGKATIVLSPKWSDQDFTLTQAANNLESAPATIKIPLLTPIMGPIDATTKMATLIGKPGATFEITKSSGKPIYAKGTFDSDGNATVRLPANASMQKINVYHTDIAVPLVAARATFTDETPLALKKMADVKVLDPQAYMEYEVPLFGPDLTLAGNGTLDVLGMENATVEFRNPAGVAVAQVTLDGDGVGSLVLSQALSGETLSAVVKHEGKVSPAERVDIPLFTIEVGAFDRQTEKLSVVGKPGATAQLQDKDGKPVGVAVVLDAQGKGAISVPASMGGESVKASQTFNGVTSAASTLVAIAPLKPTLGPVDPQTGKLDISGKPGASVQLQDSAGKPIGAPVVLDDQGKAQVQIPQTMSGQAISAVQKVNGEASLPSATTKLPLLAPVLGDVDPQTGKVEAIGKPGARVQLKDSTGKAIGLPVILDNQGKGVLQVPTVAGGQNVSAVQTQGQETSAASVAVSVPLLPPIFGAVDALTGKVAVEGTPLAKIDIKLPDGSTASVQLNAQGKGNITLPSIASSEALVGVLRVGKESSAPAPLTVPVLAPRDAAFGNDGRITAKGKPGDIILVKDASGALLNSGVVGKDGVAVIALKTPPQSGASLRLSASHEGKVSPEVKVTAPAVDKDRPLAPIVESISPSGTRILGKAKPGLDVKIINKETGQDLGTFKVDVSGYFSANIVAQPGGSLLELTATDGKKTSLPTQLATPMVADSKPPKPFDLSVDATGTKVLGKGAPGAVVLVKAADGTSIIGKGIVKPDGSFEASIAPQQGGQLLNVALQHGGKESDSETVMTPYVASNTPTEVAIVNAAGSKSTVTGKGQPGEIIRVKNAENEDIGSGVVRPDGTFAVTIPKQDAETTLAVTAQGKGIESVPAFVQVPEFTSAPLNLQAQIDATGTKITGTTKAKASVTIKGPDGKALGTVDADNTGRFSVDVAKQAPGSLISVVAQLGEAQSLPKVLVVPLANGQPAPVLDASISADGKEVSGKAVPGSNIVIKDATGKQLGKTAIANTNGDYKVTISPTVSGGIKLDVYSASSDGKSLSTPVSVIAPFQLVSQVTDVNVGQFIDPDKKGEKINEKASFLTIGSGGINWLIDKAVGGGITKKTFGFVVGKDEKATVGFETSTALSLIGVGNWNNLGVEKWVDGAWRDVRSDSTGGFFNISALNLGWNAGVGIAFETPGEYRAYVSNVDALGLGVKQTGVFIQKESLVGGYPDNTIYDKVVLEDGEKLVKLLSVNDESTNDLVDIVLKGEFGQLVIKSNGEYKYLQEKNPNFDTAREVFSYEARTESGKTVESRFEVKLLAYSVAGDLLRDDNGQSIDAVKVIKVNDTNMGSSYTREIKGKFGTLHMSKEGKFIYTPDLKLDVLNEKDVFTYVLKHDNGETVTSTLNVHIANYKTVTALNEVTVTPLVIPEPTADTALDENQAAPDKVNDLPLFNFASEQKLDPKKMVSLQPKTDPQEKPLTVKWEDLMKTGSLKLTEGSTLDLADSWKADGQKVVDNGVSYVHYVDGLTKQDVWVQSSITVV
ncbi:Ig-like domain-containing protein [Pseudomonas sp. SK3(2021)]|uniref:Ig-like domain-containing protein n=1 Tax=Pseudomonas sp. SK3(2021) TaxID=2841064 RepID=UPI0020784BC5|nr:Ig-like domain-containing protein [Pseudomonas sp. SK3(2021)]